MKMSSSSYASTSTSSLWCISKFRSLLACFFVFMLIMKEADAGTNPVPALNTLFPSTGEGAPQKFAIDIFGEQLKLAHENQASIANKVGLEDAMKTLQTKLTNAVETARSEAVNGKEQDLTHLLDCYVHGGKWTFSSGENTAAGTCSEECEKNAEITKPGCKRQSFRSYLMLAELVGSTVELASGSKESLPSDLKGQLDKLKGDTVGTEIKAAYDALAALFPSETR